MLQRKHQFIWNLFNEHMTRCFKVVETIEIAKANQAKLA
jgi:hypothetical protein